MLRCLGIYVDKNLIKYAKLKRNKNTYKVETFNVEVYEDIEEALERIVTETDSENIPICLNVSDELHNYFDVFSALEKHDINKSLEIEFKNFCESIELDSDEYDSRYILMDNQDDLDKYKALHISAEKEEIEEVIDVLEDYKLYSITPVSTSITNLIDSCDKNTLIINIENQTRVTTIIDGKIDRIDNLQNGLEKAIEEINNIEMSWKKAYDVFKNITIYNQEVKSLNKDENEYIDVILPVIEKIVEETKEMIKDFEYDIEKIYITGMGATINNIDIYFQDSFEDIECEILKPFFIDTTSVKNPIKEYIEVNSAIALALDGLGFLNKDLNFAPASKLDDLEIDTIVSAKEEFDIKNWKELFKEPLDIKEKLLLRAIIVILFIMIVFSIFGTSIMKKITKQNEAIIESLNKTKTQIYQIDKDLEKINSYTNEYQKNINSSLGIETENRVIEKDEIPNLLTKLMYVIPKKVQIVSIKNTNENHFEIKAVSDENEQIEQFVNSIKNEELLINVQTANTKVNSNVEVTIEGDLK